MEVRLIKPILGKEPGDLVNVTEKRAYLFMLQGYVRRDPNFIDAMEAPDARTVVELTNEIEQDPDYDPDLDETE